MDISLRLLISSYVGIVYLDYVYKYDKNNFHYIKAIKLMNTNIRKYGYINKRNPFRNLISKQNKYLRNNLPFMQNLLNYAINRTKLSPETIEKSIYKLRII